MTRRFIGFMVCGALAIATLPTGLLIVVLRGVSGDLGAASGLTGAFFLIAGLLLALTSWRLRPQPLDDETLEAIRRDD